MSYQIKLSKPQVEFYKCPNPSVALVAGFGSGKTEIAMYRAINTMFSFPKADILYAAPTFSLINDIWYPKVESYLTDLNVKFHIHQSKHIIKIKGCGKMFCRSMEHPHKMVGFEVLDAYLDELDTLPLKKALEVYRKAKARCRQKAKTPKCVLKWFGKKVNQILVTTTPEGFKATHELFKKNPIKNSHLIQMSTYSNMHNLPEDYIDELMSTYPSQLIEAYIHGRFVNLTQGTVYYSYNRVKNRSLYHCNPTDVLHIGMDFNVGNMSSVVHIVRNNRPHAVGEIVGVLDTPKMIQTINQKYPSNQIIVYPDASGRNRNTTSAHITDIKLLKSIYKVVVNPTNPSIRDRINSMNANFCNAKGERSYYVNDRACPNYASCLEEQCYDDNGQPDKRNNLDHLPDGAGYYITKDYGIYKPTIASNILRVN
jgi:hypothetical protein